MSKDYTSILESRTDLYYSSSTWLAGVIYNELKGKEGRFIKTTF